MAYVIYDGTTPYGLGRVRSISWTKKEPADVFSIPTLDADQTEVWSAEGCVEEITLTGIYTSSDGNLSTFINGMRGLLNAVQEMGSGYTLTTGAGDLPASTSIVCHIEEFNWEWAVGMPEEITYTLKLIERISTQ